MTWNGKQFSKPFVFLQREDIRTAMAVRGYSPGDDVQALFPSEMISTELAFQILLMQNRLEDAVNLLSCSIVPRIGVWWAYLCHQLVTEDIAQDFAKDGLTPAQRRQKQAEELAAKLCDTSDLDAMVEEHRERISKQIENLQQKAREQQYLNPFERARMKIQAIQSAFDEMKASFPPGTLGEENGPGIMADEIAQMQANIEMDFKQLIKETLPDDSPIQDPYADRIFETLRAKTADVPKAIEEEMNKHFPLKMRGLPPKPSPEKKSAAVQAALRWLLVPSDENGQLACQAAIAAQSGPESMLAYAAFWSSTNLKTETGIAPTNPALPPLGISKTLLQLALLEGGDMDYDERYRKFLELGIECADGTCTWDEHGNPVRSKVPSANTSAADDRIFRTRSGFGRQA